MTRPNPGERPESGPEIVNLTGSTSLAKFVVFCISFVLALASLRLWVWSFSRTLERSSLACREDSSWRRPWCLSGPGSGGDCNSGDGLGEETKPSPARHWEPCSQAPFGILLDCPAQSGSAGREVAMKTVFGRRDAVSLL